MHSLHSQCRCGFLPAHAMHMPSLGSGRHRGTVRHPSSIRTSSCQSPTPCTIQHAGVSARQTLQACRVGSTKHTLCSRSTTCPSCPVQAASHTSVLAATWLCSSAIRSAYSPSTSQPYSHLFLTRWSPTTTTRATSALPPAHTAGIRLCS